jgi:hypothetical protein
MILRTAMAGGLLLAAAFVPAGLAAAAPTDAALAMRWAPVHYQDTDSSDYDADYLSAVDFDGDWNPRNNWEHQDDSLSRLNAVVYYSVAETSTHWFIVYAFYHPRDWTEFDPFGLESHENDMEGVLLTVRRDGSTFGTLQAMVTVAHSDFWSYTPSGSPYTNGRETIDGTVRMQSHAGASHPTTFQEAKGHGVYAWNGGSFPGGDGVVYLPSPTGVSEVPSSGNDRAVAYRLVDIFAAGGLWSRRSSSTTFASFGVFRGDNGVDNAAHAPWRWDDKDDGSDLQSGQLALDPARLVSIYFNNEAPFSGTYTRLPYST